MNVIKWKRKRKKVPVKGQDKLYAARRFQQSRFYAYQIKISVNEIY